MPEFESQFIKTRGQPIQYGDKTLHLSDKIHLGQKGLFSIHIVSTNSEWRQGIGIQTDGSFLVAGREFKNGFGIWEDTAPEEVHVQVKSGDGVTWIYNAWDRRDGSVDSGHNGAAMIIEEIPNGRRYYCNDGHPDDNFDDIVFEITFPPADHAAVDSFRHL